MPEENGNDELTSVIKNLSEWMKLGKIFLEEE